MCEAEKSGWRVEVARIPLDDAVGIPANPPTPRNVQRMRDYLTTCWYAGWWREVETIVAWFRKYRLEIGP